ncbi:hypothetical protein A9K55_001055 [Cordyceps militaris]|uniref:Glycosyl transferase CAP10 domain-containing protein n=1 Tax=Cordyceps militaris TaxID=73501 RepID=A0A2H4SU36_CORMI|nr:hypothetical protein A9K55_001055 [Cordyceps militaris]
MWQSDLYDHRRAVGSTAVAALASWTASKIGTGSSQIPSDIVCWSILPFLLRWRRSAPKLLPLGGSPPLVGDSTRNIGLIACVFAVGIAVQSFSRAENRAVGLLRVHPRLYFFAKPSDPSRNGLANTAWGNAIISMATIYSLSLGSALELLLSAAALVGSLVALGSLLPRDVAKSRARSPLDLELDISSIAPRVLVALFVALGIQSAFLGLVPCKISAAVLEGAAKAVFWYSSLRARKSMSWMIVPSIQNFSFFARRNPFRETFGSKNVLHLLGALLTVFHLTQYAPRGGRSTSLLWLLFALPLVPFTANEIAIYNGQSLIPKYGPAMPHPAGQLVERSISEFNSMLKRQSSSLPEAEAEYRRRYGMEPPPGFKHWYEFAAAHDSPLIDEFDSIVHSVSPLWKRSPAQIKKAMSEVLKHEDAEIWHCKISGADRQVRCTHPYRSFDRHTSLLVQNLLANVDREVPDVELLVNHLDEPRSLFSPGTVEDDSLALRSMSHVSTWDNITRFCPVAAVTSSKPKHGIPFVNNVTSMMDLCQHPEYREMHGLFQSPTSFRLIEGFAPILSTGSPSTMHDILYPSAAYIESEFKYTGSHDIPWDQKSNKLYWAGSTSGAFSAEGRWNQYHRQRFVEFAQNQKRTEHFYLKNAHGQLKRSVSRYWNSRLYDVAFTRVFQCESQDCREQRSYFDMKSWADKDEAMRFKLTFDMDGNGISGRYYKLLASNSAPLKQTLLREWHDDRLKPWVHYIPVSQGMEELPELVQYLTQTEDGREHARRIAENGQKWFIRAFREIDMSIYFHELESMYVISSDVLKCNAFCAGDYAVDYPAFAHQQTKHVRCCI